MLDVKKIESDATSLRGVCDQMSQIQISPEQSMEAKRCVKILEKCVPKIQVRTQRFMS